MNCDSMCTSSADTMCSALTNNLTLPPLKKRHERKTFATKTLKLIHSRLQYYRKILNQPPSDNLKKIRQRQRIQQKYDHNMKVRALLNRAVRNLYI